MVLGLNSLPKTGGRIRLLLCFVPEILTACGAAGLLWRCLDGPCCQHGRVLGSFPVRPRHSTSQHIVASPQPVGVRAAGD